ncbi:hypothetical protein AVEN_41366-1 [Araneus ventricosus]|uniref:Uncharacterized protein n=1 Tax=Araneus ventricosus TaxID=182803 RepID=A0A4Y2PTK7_ARAVE|nr:hypothetical protein AVEN_41366-1 [Araneus ventricosus]
MLRSRSGINNVISKPKSNEAQQNARFTVLVFSSVGNIAAEIILPSEIGKASNRDDIALISDGRKCKHCTRFSLRKQDFETKFLSFSVFTTETEWELSSRIRKTKRKAVTFVISIEKKIFHYGLHASISKWKP